jgi:hypothetical protein
MEEIIKNRRTNDEILFNYTDNLQKAKSRASYDYIVIYIIAGLIFVLFQFLESELKVKHHKKGYILFLFGTLKFLAPLSFISLRLGGSAQGASLIEQLFFFVIATATWELFLLPFYFLYWVIFKKLLSRKTG